MKIKGFILISFLLLLLGACTKSNRELNEMITFDEGDYIDLILYNSSQEIFDECKNKIEYYRRLLDREHSYEGIENVYTINQKRSAIVSSELAEAITYANEILSNYDSASLVSGGLNDIWYSAYLDKSTPSYEIIERELNIIKETRIEVTDTLVSIIGQGSLDLDFMTRGFMLSKLLEYLKENKVSEYIINDSSRAIIYGHNPDAKYFKCSFFGIKNGYYKIDNIAMSCGGADITKWYREDGYRYTTIPSCTTGVSYDGYEKLFVFGENPLLNDILFYVCFNLELEEVQKVEEKYKIYTMMYKDLNLVYRNEYLTNLML
ncbi:MAG: FAD:protein FMN transferase [Roseburia sp.]|nr:FAD:protein FMN transferase [Anaeroplasma bactoclasticum]MCM1196719.1 FAD:protein FMN transferase [Roseburia sp.]MCM1557675.1 FAD:protein FMN transferase [Anaeroplasma bactoclasticum]